MWTELSFLVMSLLVWNFLSSNLCYSDCLFFLFTSNCGRVFSSHYPPTSLPFQYPCWVWDTRTHHNWDNEVTSWTEVLSSCWTIIPISTSFPLGWLNFKAGWVFPVPEENLTHVWLCGSDFVSLVLGSVKHKLCCSGPESRAGENVWAVQALGSKRSLKSG